MIEYCKARLLIPFFELFHKMKGSRCSRLVISIEMFIFQSEGSAEHRGGSVRSSDGGGSFSGCEDFGDERLRIERKMEQIKERLTRISLAREGCVI